MALTDYVTLNITNNTVGLTALGFGTGLYVSYVAAWAERTRLYSQYTDVLVDFPNTTGPEARLASAYFSQSPAPTQLMIGRGANKPTKVMSLSAVSPTGSANYTYQLNVRGDGVTDTLVTYTSDGTPTDAEYAAGIVSALNAVAGKNYTATGATSPVTITGSSAGAWFEVEILDPNHQTIKETHADPGIAADLIAITAENPNWYMLLTGFNSQAYSTAAAVWVEANPYHLYLADTGNTTTITTAVGNGDLMDTFKTNAYSRSAAFYHPFGSQFPAAALAGKCLPFNPGSETWAFKNLATISTFAMTATARSNITSRNGNSYELVAGVGLTFNGQAGSGGFIDTKRGLDWLQDDMSKAVFGALLSAPKIPYTDAGIAVIQSQVNGSLIRAGARGIIDPATIVITVPALSSVPSIDKTNRVLNNVKFSAVLQGAIHKTVINGSVTS